MKNTAVISIGSNIDPEVNISRMLIMLGKEVKIIKVSQLVKTKPIGIEDQPDFTNGAVKIRTKRNQIELKQLLISIEDQLGRDRSQPKYGPRTIDLDIVLWNDGIVDPDYYTRDFLKRSIDQLK